MYRPSHFSEDDPTLVVELARRAGFGHLVIADDDGLTSTPMPFVISDDGATVRAHLARPNQIWKLAPCDALLIVPVSDAYISPSWYPSKAEHGKVVPTWNYEVVHLHGRLFAHDDADWLDTFLRDLTDLNEKNLATPWSVDDAPSDYVEKMARGIVGVELAVERVEAKRKLSQNKPTSESQGSADGLLASGIRGSGPIASAMFGEITQDDSG